MSDLTAKFDEIQAQIATQHTEITDDLEAILTALGAPPPGDLITLEDISAQLTTLNTNVLGIASDNSTFYSAMASTLSLLSTNIETMLNNASTNAQAIIAAIYATSCACPTPSALLPPDIATTPTSLEDEAKCRRIQFYLSVFGNWLTKIANYGSAAGFVTGDTLGALLALATAEAGIVATGAEVGAAAGPPGLVVGAVIGLISGAIFTLGGSVLVDYANQFNDPVLRNAMVLAMFAADNADDGYTAFKTTLLASMSTIPAEIIYTLWWTAWSNDVYSGSPVVDDSAFDGSICAPDVVECATPTSVYTHYHQWETDWTGTSAIVKGTGDDAVFASAPPFDGWVVTAMTGPTSLAVWIINTDGSSGPLGPGVLGSIGVGSVLHLDAPIEWFEIFHSDTEFTVTLCPPS